MRNIWIGGGVALLLLIAVAVWLWPRPEAGSDSAGNSATAQSQLQADADDLVLGRADAPITVIEYASLTCPHCAAFHSKSFPRLRQEFIETGKVRWVYRDFPLDQNAMAASKLARCGGPQKFFGFLEILFGTQPSWAASQDIRAEFARIGRMGGLEDEQIDACLSDSNLENAILARQLAAERDLKVGQTPTFFINGEVVTGNIGYEEFEKRLLAGGPS